MKIHYKISLSKLLIYIVLIIQSIIVIYPLCLMIFTSFKNNLEIFKNPLGPPQSFFYQGYLKLIELNFGRYFVNSLVLSLLSLILVIFCGILVSYAVARYNWKSSKIIYFYILIGMMIPIKLGVLNLYDILGILHLQDSLGGLIMIYIAMTMPFTIFILKDFIGMIPREMDEAAYIDGCGTFGIIFKVIIPTIKPALLTVVTYNFMTIWNDVYFPLIFIHDENNKTLALGVTLFFGQFSTDWNLTFSALTVAVVPTLLIYLLFSKSLIKGIMSGAVKG